ncbi:MAG TPA: thioredoxin domain-containing protein [Nocardioidaceae bacterium]|nr:thioredoxin domain-containing protein [Nocardioidaceae bacterium]
MSGSNRLVDATSPYLLQHAHNPVDWWQWGDDAFAEARRRNVPVLLSVGYAACHWCHVMAHESFEDEQTAAYLNRHFVCVKVDREERPDVDAVYMTATQAMTGHGGWPMTCVLTPDGEPFFCGTYFPLRPGRGMPAFLQVLAALVDAWTNRRDEVARVGSDVVAQLRGLGHEPEDGLGNADLAAAVTGLADQFDPRGKGFGGAPKFPPSMVLEFLLRHASSGSSAGSSAGPSVGQALSMAGETFTAMARGGVYDQLGGGFARYSVDDSWSVPHFEKMLYDNALLLRAYLHWWCQTGDLLGQRVARETADFCLRELLTEQGGFASALDADTDGHEGRYYVWTPAQLNEVLGTEDGAWAAQLLMVTQAGTFEHGASTLQLRMDPDDGARWQRVRSALLAARERRTRPPRDDKVVAAWNGLAVTALAEAGVLLAEPRYVSAAVAAGELLAGLHTVPDGSRHVLLRTSRDGRAGPHAGVLDDYGCVAEAYLALLGATGDPVWLTRAEALLERVLTSFANGRGGFHDTADDAETLVLRPSEVGDNASPSGTSAAAAALVAYAAVSGSHRHREAAESAVRAAAGVARRAPRFAGWTLAVAEALRAGPVEVAVVGAAGDSGRERLHRAALGLASPGVVVVAAEPGTSGVPLLEGRDEVEGRAAAYVCREFTCQRPVTDPASLGSLV